MTWIDFHDCKNFAILSGLHTNYAKPFHLTMTINTSPLHDGPGTIFNDQINSNSIVILWTESSTLEFVFKFEQATELRETIALNKSQNYDVEIIFDGNYCQALLDGYVVGGKIDCLKGFGNKGSPMLCYNNVYGSWAGTITNLLFKSSKGKFTRYFKF